MARTEPTGRHTRRTGLIVAASVFLLGAGVVGFFAATSKSRSSEAKPAPALPTAAVPPTDAPPVDLGATPTGAQIREIRGSTVQFIDRQDPSRIAGQLQWESLDPLDAGRSAIVKPVGFYYLKNGAVVRISAAKGRIYTPPKSKQPESGTFDGGVTFALYEPDAKGTINIDTDKPAILAQTRSVDFDLAAGRIDSPDPFTITSDIVKAQGKGFGVLYNQVSDSINLLQVNEQASVTVFPAAARARKNPAGTGKSESTDPDAPAPLAKIAMYRALFESTVRIVQGPRHIEGDEMEVFLRLVNNQLPTTAFASPAPGAANSTAAANRAPAGADGPAANQQRAEGLLAGDAPVTLTWVGKLTVRPLEQSPAELAEDHLLARITGNRTGPVVATDDSLQASATAASVQVGATSRRLLVNGKPGSPARLAATGRGEIITPALDMNLGTGLGRLDGPGRLVGDPTSRELASGPVMPDRQVHWNDRAEIQFSAENDAVTGKLEVATFFGGVLATSRTGEVRGDFARVTFAPRETGDRAGESELAAVNLRGGVRAQAGHGPEDARRGSLTADAVDLRFDPTDRPGDPMPVELLASGAVRASRDEQALSASIMQAILGRNDKGDAELITASAESSVVFTGAKDLKATTDRLDADADTQVVFLTGPGSRITRQGSILEGEQFMLMGDSRELYAVGPGRFTHTPAAARRDDAPKQVTATWQRMMHVNDPEGRATVEGQAVVTAAGDLEFDTLKAEQVAIAFSPAPTSPPAPTSATPGTADSGDRTFVSAEALGSLHADKPGFATVESRRYIDAEALAARDEKKLERLVYLESTRVIATNPPDGSGTISVPQAGKLLVVDKRPAAAAPAPVPAASPVPQLAGARGTSLFSWQGDLLLRRSTGTIEMHRKTRLIHQPEGANVGELAGIPLLLDADSMTAWFNQTGTVGGGAGVDAAAKNIQLLKAAAEGSVLAESNDQRLTADLVSFNAVTPTLEAAATGPNNVVLSDKTRPSPLQARKLLWQLGQGGQIRVTEPATIVAPQ